MSNLPRGHKHRRSRRKYETFEEREIIVKPTVRHRKKEVVQRRRTAKSGEFKEVAQRVGRTSRGGTKGRRSRTR